MTKVKDFCRDCGEILDKKSPNGLCVNCIKDRIYEREKARR